MSNCKDLSIIRKHDRDLVVLQTYPMWYTILNMIIGFSVVPILAYATRHYPVLSIFLIIFGLLVFSILFYLAYQFSKPELVLEINTCGGKIILDNREITLQEIERFSITSICDKQELRYCLSMKMNSDKYIELANFYGFYMPFCLTQSKSKKEIIQLINRLTNKEVITSG
jgi:hypothetical protein